jgi:hypothetical protein
MYPEKFFQYYRMSVTSFDELLNLIGENIVKQDTTMRQSIHPAERLVICLKLMIVYDFVCTYCVECLSDPAVQLFLMKRYASSERFSHAA